MTKCSVFSVRYLVFVLLITGYWTLNTLALPSPSLAANCSVAGDSCCYAQAAVFCNNGLDCVAGICQTPAPTTLPGALDPLCGTDNLGVSTAIGCLMAGDPKQLVSQLLGWGVGIGGGIAFLMIIFAGFQMATASGDPKRVKAAQELLTSALAGLMLIVFSIFLLNFIGIKILNLGTIGGPLP